jgi:hypothetical protein
VNLLDVRKITWLTIFSIVSCAFHKNLCEEKEDGQPQQPNFLWKGLDIRYFPNYSHGGKTHVLPEIVMCKFSP